jgi:hypothetical protein
MNPLIVFDPSPRVVTLDEKLLPVIMSDAVGGDGVPIVNIQKLGYLNVAFTLFDALRLAVYAVPVTLAGRLNVVNVVTVRVVVTLSLCTGVVNVNIPPPVVLLTCPPVEDIICE